MERPNRPKRQSPRRSLCLASLPSPDTSRTPASSTLDTTQPRSKSNSSNKRKTNSLLTFIKKEQRRAQGSLPTHADRSMFITGSSDKWHYGRLLNYVGRNIVDHCNGSRFPCSRFVVILFQLVSLKVPRHEHLPLALSLCVLSCCASPLSFDLMQCCEFHDFLLIVLHTTLSIPYLVTSFLSIPYVPDDLLSILRLAHHVFFFLSPHQAKLSDFQKIDMLSFGFS